MSNRQKCGTGLNKRSKVRGSGALRRKVIAVSLTAEFAAVIAGLYSPLVAAQSEDAAAKNEQVVITGSRIRGAAAVGSNVISMDADAIAQTAPLTVGDLLKSIPQISFLGFDESSFANTTGTGNVARSAAVNIHGLGPQATLLLFDGHRMPMGGLQADLVDPSAIPTIALERVDVVPDGASAIYGSDAIAGVVNLIPRHNFDGALATAHMGFADGYTQHQASAIVGKTWQGGNAWLAIENSEHSRLSGLDRSYYQSNLTGNGGADYRLTQCNPGNILIGTTSYAIPNGSVTPASLVAGTKNRCDMTRYGDILPQQDRTSAAFRGSQAFGDQVTVWAEGVYSRRALDVNATSQGSSTVIANIVVPKSNAFYVAPLGLSPASETIQYSFLSDLGPIHQTGYNETSNIYVGADVKLPSDWKLNLTALYGRDVTDVQNMQVNAAALNPALASSNPATAFNPYGTGLNSPAMLSSAFSTIFRPYAKDTLAGGEVRADGPVFQLPGGMVRLAVGAEVERYSLDAYVERGPISTPTFLPSANSRTVKSAYLEGFIPIVGTNNALSGVRRLDLSIADRQDNYSDVGSTNNPKVGLNWKPVDGLQFKGSYGKSFRAPFLTDTLLFRPGTAITPATLPDPLSATGQSTGIRYVAGNPTLQPETAKTTSLGLSFKPTSIKGLGIDATWFSIDYDNQISSQLQNNAILQQAAIYPSVVTRNPSASQVAALLATGFAITGVLPASPAFIVDGRPSNLGKSKIQGIDFGVNYGWSNGGNDYRVGLDGTYNITFKLAQSAAAPLVEQINTINYPIRLRARGNFGWTLGNLSTIAYLNYSSSYQNNTVTPAQTVSSWTTADIHIAYTLEDHNAWWYKGLSIGLDVTNILDRKPPFVNIDGGYDSQQASAVGRMTMLSIGKKW